MSKVMQRTSIEVEPMTPAFGAVISGVDTKAPLDDRTTEQLMELLMKFKVIFFRAQSLSYEEQHRFAGHFGEPRVDPLEDRVPGFPGLGELDAVPFFHSDWMFQPDPPSWSMLQLTKVPPVGGDTFFVDLVAGYAALSAPMRALLEGLTVFQQMDPAHAEGLRRRYVEQFGTEDPEYRTVVEKLTPRSQPLVRHIPETGRNNYWISPAYSRRINELTELESDAVLRMLFAHMMAPRFVIRWRWGQGDIAFWDHRTTLHSGVRDYGDAVRFGCRASMAAAPVLPAVPEMSGA